MLSQGNTMYDQWVDDVPSPDNFCTSQDQASPGLDHLGYCLYSQGDSFDQYNENGAVSPTGSDVWKNIAGLSVSRQQIKDHNSRVGWQQWITLKGVVYDTTSFKEHFIAYNKKKAKEKAAQESSDGVTTESIHHDEYKLGHSGSSRISNIVDDLLRGNDLEEQKSDRNDGAEDASDDDVKDEEWDDYYEEESSSETSSSDEEGLWKYNVITALQKTGLSMGEIETEIRPFKIGTLQNPALPRWKYWDSIRTDILAMCDDIAGKDSAEISKYESEYLALLQRWLHKYRDIDPVDRATGGDGNISVFFLTEDPDTLRDWMKTSPPFDTELPDSGAWATSELLLSPLGDTHDVFSAALRSHNSSKDPFSHDIQGKVAWTELPQDAIKNDQMTPSQQLVYESRLRRGDRVHDPTLMKRRRERLGSYFQRRYKYSEKKMAQYLQWATVMEQNQRDLDALCHAHV